MFISLTVSINFIYFVFLNNLLESVIFGFITHIRNNGILKKTTSTYNLIPAEHKGTIQHTTEQKCHFNIPKVNLIKSYSGHALLFFSAEQFHFFP